MRMILRLCRPGGLPMKSYGSFLIRFWLIRNASAEERTVIDIEHVQTGEHARVTDLREAQEWLKSACGATSSEDRETASRDFYSDRHD